MRYLYTFLFYLILPGVFLRLLWRSRKEPHYRQRLKERLGYYSFSLERCIWVHAVSVGEVIAAIPLIQSLKRDYPNETILVTTMTPTGSERVKAAFQDQVKHVYLPYDLPHLTRRFFKTMHPKIAIMMETELWPNLFAMMQKNQLPICILNARLSKRSARRYGYVPHLINPMLKAVALIAANSEADAKRFICLGASPQNVVVTGNIKFDLTLPDNLLAESAHFHEQLGKDRFIWVAASTHPGEEEIILKAHAELLVVDKNALLILVPRHQGRFTKIATEVSQSFKLARRSNDHSVSAKDAQVFLGDSMGELLLFYSVANVAFVGGSLVPRGGHNFVEPAALGKAILIGPHVFNFSQMFTLFANEKAILKVENGEELSKALINLLQNESTCSALSKRALAVVDKNRGALAKQLIHVSTVLSSRKLP